MHDPAPLVLAVYAISAALVPIEIGIAVLWDRFQERMKERT